ncbi:MAG TPA: hypothetical protein VHS31_09665 [Tepidisphaeraceae bacterium]|jgi:hypothetical protein|nr:hypothetical protein [Tepidisphaeraceae bacterium]
MLAMAMNWDTGTWAVVLVFGIPIIAIISEAWVRVERSRSENDLKRSMVERGMSVEEIERVITARAQK